MNLNRNQLENLAYVKQAFSNAAEAKYIAGAKEHAHDKNAEGDLTLVPIIDLIDHIEGEIIDLVIYFYTLKQKMHFALDRTERSEVLRG